MCLSQLVNLRPRVDFENSYYYYRLDLEKQEEYDLVAHERLSEPGVTME